MGAVYTGKNLIQFVQVNSTNSIATELLSNTKPLADGTVIMADQQTNGRGQLSTHWESEAGKNITMSLIYYPNFLAIDNQFQLSMAISLGLQQFLRSYLKDVRIKWPNDIYVGNKKIAGVLIENSIQNNALKTSVIGIGINVNQTIFTPGATNPTSLAMENHCQYDLKALLDPLFEAIEFWYEQLKSKNNVYITEQYLSKLLGYLENREFEDINGVFRGQIIGIKDTGQLLIEAGSLVKVFNNKEIRFLL